MKKRIVAVITTVVVTALAVVPAFASPTSEFESAAATQKARSERLAVDKENLENFQDAQKAKSAAQIESGVEAEKKGLATMKTFQEDQLEKSAAANASRVEDVEKGQAAVKSFQEGQLEKSAAQQSAGLSALETAQNFVKSFWSSQKATEEADLEERAEVQKKVNKYLAGL